MAETLCFELHRREKLFSLIRSQMTFIRAIGKRKFKLDFPKTITHGSGAMPSSLSWTPIATPRAAAEVAMPLIQAATGIGHWVPNNING